MFFFHFNHFDFRFLSAKPETNAMVRTTTAVTIFNAGIKVRHHKWCHQINNTAVDEPGLLYIFILLVISH